MLKFSKQVSRIFSKIIEYLPVAIELTATVVGVVCKMSCSKTVKILLVLAYVVVALFCIGCICEPYAIDLEHPIDTAGRFLNEISDLVGL